MSWVSTSEVSGPRAFDLLSDRTWRLRHSLWILWGVASCGLLAFVGFLFVAAKLQRRTTWLIAAGWTVVAIGMFLYIGLTDEARKAHTESGLSSAIGMTLYVLCLVSVGHMFLLNRDWLRWKANDQARRESLASQMASARYSSPSAPSTVATTSPLLDQMGVASSNFYGPPPVSAPIPTPPPTIPATPEAPVPPPVESRSPIDVNSADVEQICAGLHVSREVAERILRERRVAPFRNEEDFALRSGIAPHEFRHVQDLIVVQRPPGSSGRVLDL